MNKTPSILVDTGFEVDQNGALTEIVVPAVVDVLKSPTKISFMGRDFRWVLSGVTDYHLPNTISFPNLNTASGSLTTFQNNASLYSLNIDSITGLEAYNNYFADGSGLVNLSAVNLVSIKGSNNCYTFQKTKIVTLYLPSLDHIGTSGGTHTRCCPFGTCQELVEINLPKLRYTYQASPFLNCTSLTTVTLGSDGNPVQGLNGSTFNGCTQSGLTITIYTSGGAALSGSPWGATNATIEYEEA